MKKSLWLALFLLIFNISFAQSYFEDGLSAAWHKDRREALRQLMPENSVAVIFNNPVKNRSNDVDFIYHPNTDFYYLTGFREPNSVLVIFSEKQSFGDSSSDELIFVQPRDVQAEMWNGKRLGVEGVREKLGFEQALLFDQFGKEPLVDFGAFDMILSFNLGNEIEKSSSNEPLLGMISSFKSATNYSDNLFEVNQQLYELIRATDLNNSANVAQIIGRYGKRYPEVENDPILKDFLNADSPEKRMAVKSEIPDQKINITALAGMMDVLREVKTVEEQNLIRKASKISAIGQIEVMKAAKVGMSEREIQGIHEFIYKRYGAESVGYPSIVGGGNNGCILHYIENDMKSVEKRLLLMDLGAEWKGYTADVTRTIPVTGKFTEEEKLIYELVLRAQDAGIALCKEGTEFSAVGNEASRIIDAGLAELGIIEKGQRHNFFPHGTSHHLGLDVHDRGGYGPLKAGAVLTVEPGIYIPDGSNCDPKWWGIAVRIEDDILITSSGPVNLSQDAPRTIADIELMMRVPSVLEDWVLPEID